MKLSRHIAGAFVEVETQRGASFYKVQINGVFRGTFQLDNTQGVMALIETVFKTDPKQKELPL